MKAEEIREVVDKLQEALTSVQRMYETKTRQEAEFAKLVSEQEPLLATPNYNFKTPLKVDWREEIKKANPRFVTPGPDYQERVLEKLKGVQPPPE